MTNAQTVALAGGATADLFLLRYDSDGTLLSVETEKKVKRALATSSDVFLFSHGWNNVFQTALDRYRSFITGYAGQGQTYGVPKPPGYKPLLIGVIWPSTSFVFPWEAGPAIAAAPSPDGREAAEVEEMLQLLTESLPAPVRAAFVEHIDGRTALGRDDALQLADLALQFLRGEDADDGGSRRPNASEFLDVWAQLDGGDETFDDDSSNEIGLVQEVDDEAVGMAGGFSLDPRNLLRAATVWKMKARAGDIGAHGVGPLVGHILSKDGPRLHLIGHSFGARVLLSALATAAPPRKAHSMLLLQPAVNRWCFASDVAGTGRKGGYHAVPELVERPVLTTLSKHDGPLHNFFHLAMRGSHLGEPDIAAVGNPDLYGALGGYGPSDNRQGRTARQDALSPQDRYDLANGARVIAVDGSLSIGNEPAIPSHGAISSPVTWWALHCLTRPD
ncbi:hypothetical protein E4N62_45500 [Streptomyces sp. MNU76]|uniref:hypothetical protein n=1 Tax=Streptomyces sp. MNU76 TaxID=2560026 RepID=UPI001E2BCE02|nr:hypothetical protein [Streptomyces sp. MNU76]MCC9711839.1 hypothetical protein [Streptomyces sp. MNU76]